jgi:hypothetical protein
MKCVTSYKQLPVSVRRLDGVVTTLRMSVLDLRVRPTRKGLEARMSMCLSRRETQTYAPTHSGFHVQQNNPDPADVFNGEERRLPGWQARTTEPAHWWHPLTVLMGSMTAEQRRRGWRKGNARGPRISGQRGTLRP